LLVQIHSFKKLLGHITPRISGTKARAKRLHDMPRNLPRGFVSDWMRSLGYYTINFAPIQLNLYFCNQ